MIPGILPGAPEQGQLVTVRQRQFVVSEVLKSTLPISPLKSVASQSQHLVDSPWTLVFLQSGAPSST
jgi:hypothetical protein